VPAVLRPSNGPTLGAAVGPGTSTTLPSGPLMVAPGALGGPEGRSRAPPLCALHENAPHAKAVTNAALFTDNWNFNVRAAYTDALSP
jgi:hypothetical protein